jgi:hypothetical protein
MVLKPSHLQRILVSEVIGIKREVRCKSGAIPVAVKALLSNSSKGRHEEGPSILNHCFDNGKVLKESLSQKTCQNHLTIILLSGERQEMGSPQKPPMEGLEKLSWASSFHVFF